MIQDRNQEPAPAKRKPGRPPKLEGLTHNQKQKHYRELKKLRVRKLEIDNQSLKDEIESLKAALLNLNKILNEVHKTKTK